MDFQKLLFEVGKALNKNEVKALAFLCTDLLGRNPSGVTSAGDLFSRLADQTHLSAERPHLLIELLLIIQRPRLVRDLGLTGQAPSNLISPYRELLYNLSEELTDEDLRGMKFLLDGSLPRRKLEENVTTLELFREMEHMELIRDTDLNLLESILQEVCPMLTEKINQFKAQHVPHSGVITQETGRPRSKSYPEVHYQVPRTRVRALTSVTSEEMSLSELSPGMNSSYTSMDFPNTFHGERECEDLSLGLSGLRTETSSCASFKVSTDALVIPQEKETSGRQIINNNTDLKTYTMTSAKRGICLIINNYDFSKSIKYLQNREGTMIDEDCLQKVFEWLRFEVVICKDCESTKMLLLMQELSRRDHSQMDCVVCCILSHGEEGQVYGVDGRTVFIRKLMEALNGSNCYSLAGKPKLFFIQACQGNNQQRATYIESDGPRQHVDSDAIYVRESIPSDADFLMGMSTVPSYLSYRERKNGTWYIQALCSNLVKMVPSGVDLVSILTKVNADVSQKTDSTGVKKQMPQPAFTLTKKVVFPVSRASPPLL